MSDIANNYLKTSPELVLTWKDNRTDAEAWFVINSKREGAAAGEIIMKKGLTFHEVLLRAKVMELQYSVSGPQIGGAVAGINFDPDDTQKNEVLARWFEMVGPLFRGYVGIDAGKNISINDIIPYTENLGIWHPMEGVLDGYYKVDEILKINRIGRLQKGNALIRNDQININASKQKYKLLDVVLPFSIVESIKRYYEVYGNKIDDKKIVINGLGLNAIYLSEFLIENGAFIVGFVEENKLYYKPEGFVKNELQSFKENDCNDEGLEKKGVLIFEINSGFMGVQIDVLIMNSDTHRLSRKSLEYMFDSGLELIASGIFNSFEDSSIYGTMTQWIDENVSVIPFPITNCGKIVLSRLLMEGKLKVDEKVVFTEISNVVKNSISNIFYKNFSEKYLLKTFYEIAFDNMGIYNEQKLIIGDKVF